MTNDSAYPPRRRSLKDFAATPVRVSTNELVRTSSLNGWHLPLVVEPAFDGVDFPAWIDANRKVLREKVKIHGAALFRGFGVHSTEYFEKAVSGFSSQLMEYTERSTPRIQVGRYVYTSTEYPSDLAIPLHNENSYSHIWPAKIWFLCLQPATAGGETPIADSRKILKLLDLQIVRRFVEKRIMYVRNFRTGLGIPWQEAFQTADRAAVEQYCRHSGIEFEWLKPDHLRTRQVRPAVMQHPETGEFVWFNQAHLFHISSLGEKVRESMQAVYREDELPRAAYFGDGSAIEPEMIEAINEAFQEATVLFPWKQGDLLLLDNILCAHGRQPYAGERKIMVLMSEPSSQYLAA